MIFLKKDPKPRNPCRIKRHKKLKINLNILGDKNVNQRSNTPPNKYPVYDTKQSDDQVLVMLGLWGIQNNPSLPSLPGLL